MQWHIVFNRDFLMFCLKVSIIARASRCSISMARDLFLGVNFGKHVDNLGYPSVKLDCTQ